MSASAQVLEEVTVTAQKREQQIQDVGISVTAFTGEQQRALGFKSTTDISLHTPGLQTFNFGNGAGNVFVVRGVGQLDFADHQEQAVAVYTDGAYNSYLGGVGFSLFDVERIEVLKGPQGTLYGRNATGGVVNVVTKKPTREFESYFEAQFTEYNGYRGEFAVSGPLTETLSARFAGVKDKADGWVENALGEDGHDIDNTNARFQLMWEPRDDLEVLFAANFGVYDNNNPTYATERALNDDAVNVAAVTGGFDDGLTRPPQSAQAYADFCDQFWATGGFPPGTAANLGCLNVYGIGTQQFSNGLYDVFIPEYGTQAPGGFFADPSQAYGNGLPPIGHSDREQYGITGTVTWDISDTLKAVYIADFRKFDKSYREDADGTAIYVSDFYIKDDSSQWSQEVRLEGTTGNLQWTTGFYYLSIEHTMFGGMDTGLVFGSNLDTHTRLDTETYAGFVQGEWAFHDQWAAIVGLRWTEDQKDFELIGRCNDIDSLFFPGNSNAASQSCNVFYPGLVNNNSVLNTDRSEGEWSGTFELNYRPTDDALIYGKFSRGNKAGGFNTGFLTLFAPEAVEFDGEILHNYEGGFKTTWMDGRLRVNGAMFYYDYSDFQSFFQLGTNFSVQNLDASVLGGELEVVTNPWDRWEFAFGLSVLDAEQEDVATARVTRDRPMPFSPDVTHNGLGRYTWPMLNGDMHIQLDYNYSDEYTMNAIDHPSLIQDSFVIANARIGWMSENGRWEAAAWVKNFTDTEYVVNGFDTAVFSASAILVPGAPRIFGGTLRVNWD